jgi:ParB-like chromosome segregation protein Spo0J
MAAKSEPIGMAFLAEGVVVPLAKILPLRVVTQEMKNTSTYRRIAASIREVGVIEPLVVFPKGGKAGQYSLLEGHTRLEILKELGQTDAFCLVATEEEAYTYNHKVSRVTPIQEHFMILRAIQSGVSEERIARALAVDVARIRQKRDLLSGVCPEAVALLRDKRASAEALRLLKKVKPMRQFEMADLMVKFSNYSASYAKCLLAATPQEKLVDCDRPKEVRPLKPEDLTRMEREVNSLAADVKLREDTYGKNMLQLMLAATYLRRLLGHAGVVRHLSHRHAEILGEFQRVVAATDLERAG